MNIENNGEQFYIESVAGKIAVLDYKILNNNVMSIYHTEVSSVLRGQGIAEILTDEAVEFAKENNLKIQPDCSYAKHYFEKHLELSDLLSSY
jgi:predicted GNAT family acetyltransferase